MIIRLVSALFASAVLAAAAVDAAASGGGAPTPVTVDAVDYAYVMPSTLKGPVVSLRLRNPGTQLHEFSLGRIDGQHSVVDALAAFKAHKEPGWLRDVGGPGMLSPGASFTYTRRLQPGRYLFLCAVPDHAGTSHVAHGMVRAFTVTAAGSELLPVPAAVVTATKTGFIVPALKAGTQTIEVRNRAGAGRGFLLTTLNPGKTQADVERWTNKIETTGKQPMGAMPMTLLGATQTIPSGTSVFVTVKFDAGRLYHISDDDSGTETTFTPR